MIVTIVGAGRLAEGLAAVRALAGGHQLRITDSEPGKADALSASLAARGGRGEVPEDRSSSLSVTNLGESDCV